MTGRFVRSRRSQLFHTLTIEKKLSSQSKSAKKEFIMLIISSAKRLSSLDVIQINKKYQCHRIDKKYLNLGKCGGNPADHKKYFIQG